MEKIFFVIPAYNESENIESVVSQWHAVVERINRTKEAYACLVVCDDGSKDGTYGIMQHLMKEGGYSYLTPLTKANSGHGATLLYLYRYALENGADYIFQTDSDGQTDPEQFWPMYENRHHWDFQIGYRKNREDGFGRVIVTKVLRIIIWMMFHEWVKDANTPFRLMKSDKLKAIMEVIPRDYCLANVAISTIGVKWQYAIKFYEITFRPRQGGVNSINMKRIFKIGWQALKDFRTINRNLSSLTNDEDIKETGRGYKLNRITDTNKHKTMIPFNKPFLTGKEAHYMYQAVYTGKLSGNGVFTKKCQAFFEQKYGFRKCLLTTSGTDALEMAAILCDIHPGDEVIVPSYTFVSSALAFVRGGGKIIFADSCQDNPNIDADKIEGLITDRTKAIVVVHYAGVACDMDKVMQVANRHGLFVVEDAAQAIDSYYKGRPLGSIGHFGCFSFHETKNITSGGEGGLLTVNDERFIRRAEIIWEKGTNRAEFFRGMVNKYGWVDTGSSFLPSEVNSAYLYAQLESLDEVQSRRKVIWQQYADGLLNLAGRGYVQLPDMPSYATNNAHMFYLVCRSLDERTALIAHLKERGILAVFHYLSLHKSEYYTTHCDLRPELPCCDRFADCLVRMPMFYELTDDEVQAIIAAIQEFYTKPSTK